jgi:hypothetical protein
MRDGTNTGRAPERRPSTGTRSGAVVSVATLLVVLALIAIGIVRLVGVTGPWWWRP